MSSRSRRTTVAAVFFAAGALALPCALCVIGTGLAQTVGVSPRRWVEASVGPQRVDQLEGLFRRLRRGDDYPLDSMPRRRATGDRRCPDVELVRYGGEAIRYRGGIRIHPAFRDRLRRFEAIVRDTSVEIYGRAPARIRLMGSYSCRSVRGNEGRLSEHAFGNAIDVSAFEIPAVRRSRATVSQTAPEISPRLRRAFLVSVSQHWNFDPATSVHSRFLHTLMERVVDSPSLFRGVIGPAHRDHQNHFHLDCGPYGYTWL